MLSALNPRARAAIGAGLIALTAAAIAWAVLTTGAPQATAKAQADTTDPITATYPSSSASADASVTVAGIGPGDVVATIVGETVDVYESAGDATPRETLTRFSYYGSVRTFMGLDSQEIDGASWLQVQLAEYPNGSQGWILQDQVEVASTNVRVNVYLDEREVDLLRGDTVELTSTAVIGAKASPTPLGTYFVSDPVDFSANTTGAYGAYALGISAFSETLETFKGGLPQIALHGTNSPQFFGQEASNGCVRLPNDVILELADSAALGTPVAIYQSRDAALATA